MNERVRLWRLEWLLNDVLGPKQRQRLSKTGLEWGLPHERLDESLLRHDLLHRVLMLLLCARPNMAGLPLRTCLRLPREHLLERVE